MEWISVKDRLPGRGKNVLIYGNCLWKTERGMLMSEITHWMPLPKPPKEMNEKTDKHCGNCICECTCRVFDIDHNDECPSHK